MLLTKLNYENESFDLFAITNCCTSEVQSVLLESELITSDFFEKRCRMQLYA